MSQVDSVLHVAHQFDGIREEQSNRSLQIDFMNWWTIRDMRPFPVGGLGASWCATFVALCGRLGIGAEWPIPDGAQYSDVDNLFEWGGQEEVLYDEPERGDLFLVPDGGGGFGHVGFVDTTVGSDDFFTIEGNTNDGGSANGEGVYERIRSKKELTFVRWAEVVNR